MFKYALLVMVVLSLILGLFNLVVLFTDRDRDMIHLIGFFCGVSAAIQFYSFYREIK